MIIPILQGNRWLMRSPDHPGALYIPSRYVTCMYMNGGYAQIKRLMNK